MAVKPSKQHALHRTSPKGGPFIGTCTQCGKQGLRLAAMWSEECENIRGLTQDESLLEAIKGDGVYDRSGA